MQGLMTYIRESFEELRYRMTWPSWSNLQQTTTVVLVGAAILALLIFTMDSVSNLITEKLIYKIGAK